MLRNFPRCYRVVAAKYTAKRRIEIRSSEAVGRDGLLMAGKNPRADESDSLLKATKQLLGQQ